MLRIGHGSFAGSNDHARFMPGAMKQRGSHGAVSISSSEDGGVQDFGRGVRGEEEGEGEGATQRPVARFSQPVDHMEVLKEMRNESIASTNDGVCPGEYSER